MIKKTLTYTNFEGKAETKDFWFNLTKAELSKLRRNKGSFYMTMLEGTAKSIADNTESFVEKDANILFDQIEEIILLSYGTRTETGGFIKPEVAREEFKYSEAFSVLFEELMTDENAMSEFVLKVIPGEMASHVEKELGKGNKPALGPVE